MESSVQDRELLAEVKRPAGGERRGGGGGGWGLFIGGGRGAGEIVVTQLWSINTLITGLLEGHISFFIRLSRRD